MISRLKSLLFLLAIVVVWGYLIYETWELQLFITLLPFAIDHRLTHRLRRGFWLWQDQGVNVLFLGSADETISSRVGVLYLMGSNTAVFVRGVIDFGFYLIIQQVNHCVVSIELDEQKLRARKLIQELMDNNINKAVL